MRDIIEPLTWKELWVKAHWQYRDARYEVLSLPINLN